MHVFKHTHTRSYTRTHMVQIQKLYIKWMLIRNSQYHICTAMVREKCFGTNHNIYQNRKLTSKNIITKWSREHHIELSLSLFKASVCFV